MLSLFGADTAPPLMGLQLSLMASGALPSTLSGEAYAD